MLSKFCILQGNFVKSFRVAGKFCKIFKCKVPESTVFSKKSLDALMQRTKSPCSLSLNPGGHYWRNVARYFYFSYWVEITQPSGSSCPQFDRRNFGSEFLGSASVIRCWIGASKLQELISVQNVSWSTLSDLLPCTMWLEPVEGFYYISSRKYLIF